MVESLHQTVLKMPGNYLHVSWFLCSFLASALSQESGECSSTETCYSVTAPQCAAVKADLRAGKITIPQLKRCSGGRNTICCKDPEKQSGGCSAGNTCIPLPQCPILLQQARAGQITIPQLRELSCPGPQNSLCCPGSSSTPVQRVDTGSQSSQVARPVKANPDISSPSYLPSIETQDCGYKADLSNIIGGEKTKPGVYSFPVLLGKFDGREVSYKCGASLINSWYVLTAGHCYNSDPSKTMDKADIGDWKVDTDPDCVGLRGRETCREKAQIIDIERWIVHELYAFNQREGTLINDIALVKLKTQVKGINDYVEPVCLPTRSALKILDTTDYDNSIEGVRAHAVGWGRSVPREEYFGQIKNTAVRNSVSTNDQLFVDLPILTQAECQKSWAKVTYPNQICAGGEEGKDSCKGDSGGPLVINRFDKRRKQLLTDTENSNWILIGITSFGASDCGNGLPGVYTRVSEYIDWIKQKIGN